MYDIFFITIKSLPPINGIENEQVGVKRDKKYAFLYTPYSVYLIFELDKILHDYKIKQNENENKAVFEIQKLNKTNEH